MKICAKCGGGRDGAHCSYCRSCYNAYKREHYAKNRHKEVARSSAWNKANAEKVAANMRAARSRDPERFRQAAKVWRAANPEAVKAYDCNKRIKRKSASQGRIEPWEMRIVLECFSEMACHYCGTKRHKITVDHKIPIARGGRHEVKNLVPACRSCNSAKRHMPPEQFALRRGRLCW